MDQPTSTAGARCNLSTTALISRARDAGERPSVACEDSPWQRGSIATTRVLFEKCSICFSQIHAGIVHPGIKRIEGSCRMLEKEIWPLVVEPAGGCPPICMVPAV